MNDLFDYVLVGNLFTHEECQQYIKQLGIRRWNPHKWYDNTESKVSNHKDFSVTYDITLQNEMFKRVVKLNEEYVTKHREAFTTQYSGIRFNRYQIGESIVNHTDHINALFDGTKKGIPVLSYVGVLNDDYDGGEFMLCGEQIPLKTGDCVVFPSIFLYPHEVKPIVNGTRYSWVTWSW